MPTPYLKTVHEALGIPMKKLEEYWEKAKEIAEKSPSRTTDKNGNSFGLVTHIFKRIVLNTNLVDLDTLRSTNALSYAEGVQGTVAIKKSPVGRRVRERKGSD